MWLVAENVQIDYAEEVYSIRETPSGKGVSLLCPTRKIRTRGDVLNIGTISVVRHSPLSASPPTRTLRC